LVRRFVFGILGREKTKIGKAIGHRGYSNWIRKNCLKTVLWFIVL